MKILLKKHFGWFYEKLNNDAIDSYAAQVSFWILISFIPFLMLVLALLQVIRFEDTSLLVAFVQMLPPRWKKLSVTYFKRCTRRRRSFP